MTSVMVLQVIFPLLAVAYVASAWLDRRDDRRRAAARAEFRPELLVRWDDVGAPERCARTGRPVATRIRTRPTVTGPVGGTQRVPSRTRRTSGPSGLDS